MIISIFEKNYVLKVSLVTIILAKYRDEDLDLGPAFWPMIHQLREFLTSEYAIRCSLTSSFQWRKKIPSRSFRSRDTASASWLDRCLCRTSTVAMIDFHNVPQKIVRKWLGHHDHLNFWKKLCFEIFIIGIPPCQVPTRRSGSRSSFLTNDSST